MVKTSSTGIRKGSRVITGRSGDVVVDCVHQLLDAGILRSVGILRLAGQGVQSGTLDDGQVVAGEVILAQQLTNLHLDQLQQLLVVQQVDLVQEHDDSRHADLTGQQDVLAGLSHGAVGSSDDQDSAVHLSSAGDHVLDIVGVARAVNVSIVTLVSLILNVSGVDGDTTLSLFGSLVDAGIILELGLALESQVLGDGSGQGGLTMVNVTDGTDVYVGLGSFKLLLGHD